MKMGNIQPSIEHYKDQTNYMLRSLNYNVNMLNFVANEKLKAISSQLRTLSPKAVMKRGFTIASTLDGEIVTLAKSVEENDFLKLQWQDSSHIIRIESKDGK